MICPVCEKEILITDKRYMLSTDRPLRLNFYVHYDCQFEIKDNNDLLKVIEKVRLDDLKKTKRK